MKTLQTFHFVTLAFLFPLGLLRGAETSATRLQKALFEEEANRNLPAAIAAYQAILTTHDEERRFAATALFRLGECYRKLAQTNEAVAQYQRLLREFPEQRTLTPLAEQNLFALGVAPASSSSIGGERAARRVSPEERKLIEEQISIAEKQLAECRKKIQVGVVAIEEDLPYQRTLIRLRRELASLDEPPGGPEQRKLLGEEIQLQEKVVQRIRKNIERGSAAASSELDAQRELLALKRELVALETSATAPRSPGAADATTFQAGESGVGKGAQGDPEEMADLLRMQVLVKNSPDLVNALTPGVHPPLHRAVERGERRVVEFLLDHGAEVNLGPPTLDTPLQWAVQGGHSAIVELLLARKANPELIGNSGELPLVTAAGKGFKAITELLLANGAKVNATNRAGVTALNKAVEQDRLETVKVLLAHGADIDRLAAQATPLMLAASYGRVDLARLLLDRGAKVDARSLNNRTPLAAASDKTSPELTELLLSHGADPNARFAATIATVPGKAGHLLPYQDVSDATPLILAAAADAAPVIQLLVKAGARLNDQDSSGNTALHWAAMRAAGQAIALLLEHGAGPNLRDRQGVTPLLLAIRSKQESLALLLLDKGADPNLASEGDRNISGDNGETPLQCAVKVGSKTMLTALLDHGADLYACNRAGETALDWANRRTDPELGNLLRARGASEAAPRPGFITACRASSRFGRPLFVQGTNSANHHTLLELFARIYQEPVPGVPGVTQIPLEFPDLDHVRIHRRDPATGKINETTVSLLEILKPGDCSKDIPLQWGDAIEFPEVDHPTSQAWKGLTGVNAEALIGCLTRRVEIIVKGETNQVRLAPSRLALATEEAPIAGTLLVPPTTGSRRLLPRDTAPSTGSPKSIPVLLSFWLRDVVYAAKVVRVSSDLSRVKVKRLDPRTGKTLEFRQDCASPPRPGTVDLWLQNGDVIDIPER